MIIYRIVIPIAESVVAAVLAALIINYRHSKKPRNEEDEDDKN